MSCYYTMLVQQSERHRNNYIIGRPIEGIEKRFQMSKEFKKVTLGKVTICGKSWNSKNNRPWWPSDEVNVNLCNNELQFQLPGTYTSKSGEQKEHTPVLKVDLKELEGVIKTLMEIHQSDEFKTALKDASNPKTATKDDDAMKALIAQNKLLMDRIAKLESAPTPTNASNDNDELQSLFTQFVKATTKGRKKK